MLYTESMEGPSPLVAAEAAAKSKSRVGEWWKDTVAQPRLDVGICLGGGLTRVVSHKRSANFSSCLALNERGKVVTLGDDAGALEGREPEGVRVVRPVQGGVLYDLDGGRRLLEGALKAARFTRGSAPQLVLAISSQPSALERDAWVTLAREAGAREVYLTSQVIASAIGSGLDILVPKARLIVHIGSGQCEVGIISLGHCLYSKNLRLGGEDLTLALREHIRNSHKFLIDRQDAEKVKHSLNLDETEDTLVTVAGRLLDTGQPVVRELSKLELAAVIRPQVAEWCTFLQQVLAEISIDWVEDVQKYGIFLTGGATQVQGLQTMLRDRTSLEVKLVDEPDKACAKGLRRIVMEGTLRRALFAPRPQPSVQKGREVVDFKILPKANSRVEMAWGTACALLGVCFMLSLHSAQASAATAYPFSSAMIPALGTLTQVDEQLKPRPPEDVRQLLSAESERQLQNLSAENRRLWKWLGRREMTAQSEWLRTQPVLARVVARDPRGWLSRWTLDVGSKDGIRAGQVVVADGGLLGQVVQVDEASSVVRLYLDKDSIVAGALQNRKAAGVLMGRAAPTLEMRYVDPDAGVKLGDRVVTSGQDGQLPAGIVLGKVTYLQRQVDSSFVSLQVTPLVRLDDVREVMVLRPKTKGGH